MPTHIKVDYVPSLAYFFVRTVDNTPHWACGKVECDCDEQTMEAMEDER
jgi:hypothetical protein